MEQNNDEFVKKTYEQYLKDYSNKRSIPTFESYLKQKEEEKIEEKAKSQIGVEYIPQSQLDDNIKERQSYSRPIINISNIGRTRLEVMTEIYGKDKIEAIKELGKTEMLSNSEFANLTKEEQDNKYNEILNQKITADMVNDSALEFYKIQNKITYRDLAKKRQEQIVNEYADMEPIGIFESFKKEGLGAYMPIARHEIARQEKETILNLISKINNNVELTDFEQKTFENFYNKALEEKQRGYSTSGQVVQAVAQSLVFMAEQVSYTKTMGVLAIPQIRNYYMKEQLKDTGLHITPKGELFFKNNWQNKFSMRNTILALGQTGLEWAIEKYGGDIIAKGGKLAQGAIAGAVAGSLLTDDEENRAENTLIGIGTGLIAGSVANTAIAKAVSGKITDFAKKLFGGKIINILNNASIKQFNEPMQEMVKKLGFNGFIGELNEEYIEKPVMDLYERTIISLTTNEEERKELEREGLSWRRFFESLGGFDSLQELLLTMGVIGIQGTAFGGLNILTNKLYSLGVKQKEIDNLLKNGNTDQINEFYRELNTKQIELAESYRKEEYNKFKKQSLEAGKTEQEVDDILNITNQILKNLAIHNNKTIGYVLQKMGGLPNVIGIVGDNTINNDSSKAVYNQLQTNNNILDLTNEFSFIKSTNRDEVAKEVEKYLNNLINKGSISTNTPPLQVEITNENKVHIKNSNIKLKGNRENRHNSSLLNLEKIINQATKNDKDGKVDLTHNTNQKTLKHKNNVEEYVYFDSPITINHSLYNVELATERLKNRKDKNLLDLYNVKIKRVATADKLISPRSSNPITMINYKNLNVNNLKQEFNNQPLGQYNTTTNIITLFEKSNPSTLIHEMGHFFLSSLKKIAPESIIAKNYLNDYITLYNEFNKDKIGNGIEEQEFFAENWEAYLRTGKAPVEDLKGLFENFKTLLRSVYGSFKDIGQRVKLDGNSLLNEKVRSYFDNFIMKPTPKNGFGVKYDDWKNKNEAVKENIVDLATEKVLNQNIKDSKLQAEMDKKIEEIYKNQEKQKEANELKYGIKEQLNIKYAKDELNTVKDIVENIDMDTSSWETIKQQRIDSALANRMAKKYQKDNRIANLEKNLEETHKTIEGLNKRINELEDEIKGYEFIEDNANEQFKKNIELIKANDNLKKNIEIKTKQAESLYKKAKAIEYDNQRFMEEELEFRRQLREDTEKVLKEQVDKIYNELATENEELKHKLDIIMNDPEIMAFDKARKIIDEYRQSINKIDENITKTDSESMYKNKKMYDYIHEYNKRYQDSYSDRATYTANDIETDEDITPRERRRVIKNRIYEFINKIFANMVEEENNYIVQVFTRVNEGRKEVQEEAKAEGIDVGIKPFETVREMLEDYEKRTKNLNYFEKIKRDKEIYKEDNYSGQSVSNYTLTMEEYNKIVNFRKVYLKEQIGLLEKELNQQEQTIDNLNKDLNYKNENISKLTEQIQEQSKELEDYKTLEEMLGIDFETVAEVEKALGDIKDSKLREKVLRYATGKTPNGNNRSKEYILNKLKEYQDKQIKKDYQTMIDDILAKTVHISKRKGKEYGQVVYEDSGFFKELKAINKLSKRKAEEQLLKLNSERAEGINTEPQSHFDLKKQLLFFKSQDNIKYEFMNEILTNLGNFAKESEMMQNEIRLENFNNILDNRKEVRQAINESTMQNGITNLLSYKRYLKFMGTSNGNLESILDMIGGKKLKDKYSLVNEEIAYNVGTKQKLDNLFANMIDAINGNEIGTTNSLDAESKEKLMELFREWKDTKVAKLHVNTLTEKTGNEEFKKYHLVSFKEDWERIRLKLIRELEYIEETQYNTNNQINVGFFIDMINEMTPQRDKGRNGNHTYKFSKTQLENLQNLISNLLNNDNLEAKNKEEIEGIIKEVITKKYDDINDYDIDMWGLMYYDLLSRNKQTRSLLERYYEKNVATLDEAIANAPAEFKAVEEVLFNAVQDREELNPFFIIEFNQDMGKVDNYFDRRSFHQDDISLFDMISSNQDRMQKVNAIEKRSYDAIPDLTYNPLSLVIRHQRQTEYIKNIAPKLKNLNLIFNEQIKDQISQKFGDDMVVALNRAFDGLKYNNYIDDVAIDKFISYFVGNWAKSVTNTPSVLLKQLTSFLPYAEGFTGTDLAKYTSYFVDGYIKPFATKKFMNSISPYLKTRFDNNEYKNVIDIINSSETGKNTVIELAKRINEKIDTTIDKATFGLTEHTLTELGDIMSVIYGGYARYKINIENGMTHEQAIKDFEKITVSTQQSNLKTLQSVRTIKNNNLFSRAGNMFLTQDQQYFNKILQNFTEYWNGDKTKSEFMNGIILYNFVMPAMMQVVSGIIACMYGKRDKKWYSYFLSYLESVALSFTGLGLISQSVAVDLSNFIANCFSNTADMPSILWNILGTLTGKSIGNFWKLGFDRKYGNDLYDSEKESENKKKRIEKMNKENQ